MIYSTYINSVIGWLEILANEEYITNINFTDMEKQAHENHITIGCKEQLLEYFSGKRTQFNIPMQPNGTIFQQLVWKALCDIPYGTLCSYKDIAIACGNEKASRAIGMANHNNPIPIIIPCHRVVGKNGKMVGYAGGIDKKLALINLEQNSKNA